MRATTRLALLAGLCMVADWRDPIRVSVCIATAMFLAELVMGYFSIGNSV